MDNYKKHFCTFADSRLSNSLNRIENQALNMDVFDKIFIYDETKLDVEFRQLLNSKLVFGSRGYGYWCWKPQIILQTLLSVQEGDVIQYTDSGCHLNLNGRLRLLEYFDIAKKSESGILSFRSKNNWELKEGEKNYENLEYKYNKADLLAFFGVLDNPDILNSVQYEAGIIFIRKDNNTIRFIQDWINVFINNFNLIDDSPSLRKNLDGFLDHRHDQSIYSLMCKLNGVSELYSTEYYTESNWDELLNYPIWVKRDMDFGFSHRVKRRLKIY
jgi:hypothetical protein